MVKIRSFLIGTIGVSCDWGNEVLLMWIEVKVDIFLGS